MMTHTTTTTGRRAVRGRRGVAMLMVVIALVITTVLTSAVLTSPKNMADIAQNAQDAASARWSAESASNFTASAITNKVAATEIGGLYKSGWVIADGSVDVMITNVDGDAPTADDRTIIVTVQADAGDVARTIQREITVVPPVEADDVADTRLGELAIYATERLKILDTTVHTWSIARTKAKAPPRIGLGFDSQSGCAIANTSLDGDIVVGPDASAALIAWASTTTDGGVIRLPVDLPSGVKPMPDTAALSHHYANGVDDGDGYLGIAVANGGSESFDPGVYASLDLSKEGEAVFTDGAYVFDTIDATGDSRIDIVGDVTLIVRERVTFEAWSNIHIGDGASLHLWVGNELDFSSSFITHWDEPTFADPDWYKSMDVYMSPERVLIEAGTDATINVEDSSVVIGTIHAPRSEVTFDDATLIGRVTGQDVRLNGAVLSYDPALDSGVGYTNLRGPLYDDQGDPITGLVDAITANAGADPEVAKSAIASAINSKWASDGTPGQTASGYWSAESHRRGRHSSRSYWGRKRWHQIWSWKQRWLGDNTAATIEEKLDGLRDG